MHYDIPTEIKTLELEPLDSPLLDRDDFENLTVAQQKVLYAYQNKTDCYSHFVRSLKEYRETTPGTALFDAVERDLGIAWCLVENEFTNLRRSYIAEIQALVSKLAELPEGRVY